LLGIETMKPEEWKPIKGFESRFKVSNHGNIISIDGRYSGEKTLKVAIGNSGYHQVSLRDGKRLHRTRAHVLVADHFCEGKTKERFCVNHIDGNKLNNYFENLEWCTRAENSKHAFRTGLCDYKGEKSVHAKITEAQAIAIKYKFIGFTESQLSKVFGIGRRHINDIKNGVCWKHI
jgi:hypothetical protein